MTDNKFTNIMATLAALEQKEGIAFRCETCNMTGGGGQKCRCGLYLVNMPVVRSSGLETAKTYVREHRRPQCAKVGVPLYMALLMHDFRTGVDGYGSGIDQDRMCPKLSLSEAEQASLQEYVETLINN
jgi:hypothetical protein